mmetsp:Transcript_2321/g.3461  ORF Transcript_2321/g.3461 Transcript_2321/m.3461 type:complete len:726 (-) Transcript_2321:260-2437(-)
MMKEKTGSDTTSLRRRPGRKAATYGRLKTASLTLTSKAKKFEMTALGTKPRGRLSRRALLGQEHRAQFVAGRQSEMAHILARKKDKKVDVVFGGCLHSVFTASAVETTVRAQIPEHCKPHVIRTFDLLSELENLEYLAEFDLTWVAAMHPVLRVFSLHSDKEISRRAADALQNLKKRLREFSEKKKTLSINNLLICVEVLGDSVPTKIRKVLDDWIVEFHNIERFAQITIARYNSLQQFMDSAGPKFRSTTELITQWEALCQLQTQIVRLQVIANERDLLTQEAKNKIECIHKEWVGRYQDVMEASLKSVIRSNEEVQHHNYALHTYKSLMMATHSASTVPPHFSGLRLTLRKNVETDAHTWDMLKSVVKKQFHCFQKAFHGIVDEKREQQRRGYRLLTAETRGKLRLLDHLCIVLYSLDLMVDGSDEEIDGMRTELRDMMKLLLKLEIVSKSDTAQSNTTATTPNEKQHGSSARGDDAFSGRCTDDDENGILFEDEDDEIDDDSDGGDIDHVDDVSRRKRKHFSAGPQSKHITEGQCTRNPDCKRGFRHVGFCGGWTKPRAAHSSRRRRRTSKSKSKSKSRRRPLAQQRPPQPRVTMEEEKEEDSQIDSYMLKGVFSKFLETKRKVWSCGVCTLENRWQSKTCQVCRVGKRPEKSIERFDTKEWKKIYKETKLSRIMNCRMSTYDSHEKEKWALHLLTASFYCFLEIIPKEDRVCDKSSPKGVK